MVRASGSPFVGEGGAQAIPLYWLLLYMHTYVIVTLNPTYMFTIVSAKVYTMYMYMYMYD